MKIPKMPKGTKPDDRAFMVQYKDKEGDTREYGSLKDLLTFDEADRFAIQVDGMIIGWDENGKDSLVFDYRY